LNAEYINPFIQGSQSVIQTVCKEVPRLGKVFVKSKAKGLPVSVSISIINAIQGTVVYTMDEGTACFIASQMMGMSVSDLDYMAQSAVSELANMIAGNVATVFSGKGIIVDITTPTFWGTQYPDLRSKIVCIPLLLSTDKTFEVDVCLQ